MSHILFLGKLYKQSGGFMSKPSTVSDWNRIIYLLGDFITSMEEYRAIYGNAHTEEVSGIYDKELALILAIKTWVNKNKATSFKLNSLNDKERLILLEMIDKSKRVCYDKNNTNAPYSLIMFLPLAILNEKSPQIDNETLEPDYNSLEKIAKFRTLLHQFFAERISSNVDVISEENKFELEVHEKLNSDLIEQYLSEGVDLYSVEILNKYKPQLSDFYEDDLIHSFLIPVVLKTDNYQTIADFSFNNDGLYFDMLEDIGDNDIIVGEPMNLDESLLEIENLKWDMLTSQILEGELISGAVLREAQYTVIKHKDQFVRLDVIIDDVDNDGKSLQSVEISRSLKTKEDYVNSLPISFTSEEFIFNVGFVQITESELSEIDGDRMNVHKFYEDNGLDESMPPGTTLH